MHIISDIEEVKALTRRGRRRTVIAELKRRNIPFEIAHDGWPVVYLENAPGAPSKRPH